MKLYSSLILAAFISSAQAAAEEGRVLRADQTCTDEYNLQLKDGCSYAEIYKQVNAHLKTKQKVCKGRWAHQELNAMFRMQGYTLKEQELVINDMCVLAYQENQEQKGFTFEDITDETSLFTEEYFDGGTIYNEGRLSKDRNGNKIDDLGDFVGNRMKKFHEKYAKKRPIATPDIVNFQECDLRSVMCCWTQDRQANDNNGNCNNKNCVNADPGDNTDLCLVDNTRSRSPGIHQGYAMFPGDNNAGEGAIHCHGFAWADNELDKSAMYKGNNLFYVSLYDHMSKRGYVRNVPGAPMCGCLEQMPVVTRSDCTQINVGNMNTDCTLKNGRMACEVKDINLQYNACQGVNAANNLEEHYKKLVKEKKATEEELSRVQQHLVGKGNCNLAVEDFEEELLARRNKVSYK